MDTSIFRSYDVRGLYPQQIDAEIAKQIAMAYLSVVSRKLPKPVKNLKIVVARDVREASEPLMKSAVEVFLKYGAEVHDLGLVSINDFYFATGYFKYDCGFMATASHNPPGYGGFKMIMNSTEYTDSIKYISGQQVYKELESIKDFHPEEKKGKYKKRDISKDHIKHILSFVDVKKINKLKVLADTGNGMVGLILPKLFAKLPAELISIFSELDPKFANRPPNPLAKDAYLPASQTVLKNKADLGVMFDVDGDRMFLLDEKGQFIRGDMTLLLLAKMLLKKDPGAGIVYNLICSHAVPELIAKWGGRPIRSEVGYINLARHMHLEQGSMSGEVSGHFAFKENYYTDSGLIALVLALQAISEDGRPLSEIIKDFSLYYRGDEFNIEVENIPAKLEKIRYFYRDNIKDEIDGITVEFGDWWFNVRKSNTEPLVRLNCEADTRANLEKLRDEALALIRA